MFTLNYGALDHVCLQILLYYIDFVVYTVDSAMFWTNQYMSLTVVEDYYLPETEIDQKKKKKETLWDFCYYYSKLSRIHLRNSRNLITSPKMFTR